MDNPERHLAEWLYENMSDDRSSSDDERRQHAANEATRITKFMRERGWQFESAQN